MIACHTPSNPTAIPSSRPRTSSEHGLGWGSSRWPLLDCCPPRLPPSRSAPRGWWTRFWGGVHSRSRCLTVSSRGFVHFATPQFLGGRSPHLLGRPHIYWADPASRPSRREFAAAASSVASVPSTASTSVLGKHERHPLELTKTTGALELECTFRDKSLQETVAEKPVA